MNTKRSCGILLPLFSLPSEHGIGTLGKAAYEFLDFLSEAGQSWWQILPVGPAGSGDSPYQSFSSFAGNAYFIDLDMLVDDGLLTKAEVGAIECGGSAETVDYNALRENRMPLLRIAARRGLAREGAGFEAFCRDNARWLSDFALYMALKEHFNGSAWYEWPEDIRLHRADAVEKYSRELREDVSFFSYVQYLFYSQWSALRAYAREKGIGIIGDMPIYVALDSADVWAEPEFFLLDEHNVPVEVAGVPPDYFSTDGQLWGNPLYDWDAMRRDGYGWWIRRVDGASRLYDALRIDHFRAFESYWAVPRGTESAKQGQWRPGPGMDLVGRLTAWFNNVRFIAEDLGVLTPEVHRLLDESGLPGMKVLEFAFDPASLSDYLPHRYNDNCICYAGTHDNNTLRGWIDEEKPETLAFAREYLGIDDEADLADAVLRAGMRSKAVLFIAQMQDWLGLGASARMNTPGTVGGNWAWRMLPGSATKALAGKMRRMVYIYGRSGKE